MSKMHHQHEDFGKVSVDDLIPQLVHKTLGMPEVDCAQWIAKLRGHLIGNVYALSRLTVQQLQSLGLPLALEAELCSVVQKYNPVPSQTSTPSISRSGSEEFGTHAIRKKKSSKKMKEEAKTEAEKAALLGLTAETRQALKESWATVTQQRGAELNKFFECVTLAYNSVDRGQCSLFLMAPFLLVCREFYGHFLKVDRLARQLFAGASMTRQAQALMKVMSAVMSALDNPAKLIGPLKKLGCRHLIYGVERKNFQSWGISLAKTFEAVLGPEKVRLALLAILHQRNA
jgi:truncated hemoglobin YjbI